jgi:hypothetical protein
MFRVTVLAGFKMPPHKHPNLEHIMLLSGVFGFRIGEQLDETRVKPI